MGSWASVLPWTSFNGTRLVLKVPPVVVEHDEETGEEQSRMSAGLVTTDGGPPVADAVESMQAPQSRNAGPRLRLQWTSYERVL